MEINGNLLQKQFRKKFQKLFWLQNKLIKLNVLFINFVLLKQFQKQTMITVVQIEKYENGNFKKNKMFTSIIYNEHNRETRECSRTL
jgi:hypothetical protein